MKNILQAILAAIGLGAIYQGWKSLQSDMPKPTEEREVTRIDYLTGDYQKELEAREHELEKSQKKGKWYLAAGAALLAGGVTLLTEAVIESSSSKREPAAEDTSDLEDPPNGRVKNGNSKTTSKAPS